MKRRNLTAALSAVGMLMLILDARTALEGAAEGIGLCLRAVVPSLLPFFVLSMLLTSSLSGSDLKLLRPIGRLCGIPKGGESLLVVGLLGGYPVGAQSVAQLYRDGQLSEETAKRLLGFCSNAGPAFLFGIVAAKFPKLWMAWALWGIHILSALLVGMLLPGKSDAQIRLAPQKALSLSTALKRSVAVMAQVCGWVLLFRVMIAFLNRWCLWLLPESGQAAVMGLLELTNGCCALEMIQSVGARFVAASGILAFGGLCVAMQTVSVTGELGLGRYLPGKLLQAAVSMILSFILQLVLFPATDRAALSLSMGTAGSVLLAILAIVCREMKKRSSNPAVVGV